MNKIFFISDSHLKLDRSKETLERRNRLISFLNSLPADTTEIIMTGDIFDFWYEWYHVIPAYHFDFLYSLRKLIDKGVKIHYITGNHDFNLGTFLNKEVGINCFENEISIERDGLKIYISHGDGLAESDSGYRFLKKILKSKLSNFLFKTFIPPDLGIKIASLSSGSSRKLRKIERSKWKSEYHSYAENKFRSGFDAVILGHLHVPEIKDTEKGIYLNTGDWIHSMSYGKLENGKLSLEYFNEA